MGRMGLVRSIGRADWSQMVCGTLLNDFHGHIHEYRGVRITDPGHLARRYLHFLAGKPVAGFDDQVTNRPALGVYHKIADVADDSVVFLEMVAAHRLRASQMHMGRVGLRASRSCWFVWESFCWQFQDRKAANAP